METWLNIEDFNGQYLASNLGRIKSLAGVYPSTRKEKILKQRNKKGYYNVILYKDKKGSTLRVHRIVATLFIPNLENKPEVNHKDGNGLNNEVSNLEWCTSKENKFHSRNVTGNGSVISLQKLTKLYEENKYLELHKFMEKIIPHFK